MFEFLLKKLCPIFICLLVTSCGPSLPGPEEAVIIEFPSAPITIEGKASENEIQQLIFSAAGDAEQAARLKRFMKADTTISPHPIYGGNRVQLLIDGPMAFAALFEAMANARHHIHVETFILHDDEIGRRFSEIIKNRRESGVEVRIIYDATGALSTDQAYFDGLRVFGVRIHEYNPLNPLKNPRIWRINQRHHRKMIIVDGNVVFTGGMNISSSYSHSSFHPFADKSDGQTGWRDTNIQIEGPVVAHFQKLFLNMWAQHQSDADLDAPDYFPELVPTGDLLVKVIDSTAGDHEYDIYRSYINAFALAQHRIWVTQGYFSPDKRMLDTLKEAATRGVDVRLLLPGVTDSWITVRSSRAHYTELLESGVRIFERKDVLQHAKTAVVDGIWSTVGTANLDYRSFLHANEVNTMIYNRTFGFEMEEMFLLDQQQNTEILLEQWRRRSFGDRLKEFLGSAFDYWL